MDNITDALARVIQLGADPLTDGQYGWISTLVSAFLSDNSIATYDDLCDEDRCTLLDEIKLGFAEANQPLPDYLQDNSTDSTVELMTTLPDNAETLPDGSSGIGPDGLKTAISGTSAGLSIKIESVEDANKKLEVAKAFLKELDGKLAKYEAINIDAMLETLGKYESIGTIDELEKVMVKSEALLDKLESVKVASAESTSKFEAALAAAQLVNKGEGMNTKVKTEDGTGDADVAALKEQLAQYQALGTVEEIEALVGKADDLLSDNVELSSKVESIQVELTKYESIGTTEEILDVVTKFATIKQKTESERIAAELKIPVEKVVTTIDKMESIGAAEELLRTLYAKTEAELEAEAVEAERIKNEAAATAEAALRAKNESGKTGDESATVVTDPSKVENKNPKYESSPERLTKLRQLCAKL